MISIIMPFFNRWELTHRRLFEIYQYIPPENVEIILVDDASTDIDIKTGVGWWQKQVNRHTLRYVCNKSNVGFGGSMNAGAKLAKGDTLVFLSNDVAVSGNFLQILFNANEENGSNVLICNEIIDWKAGWNEVEIDNVIHVIPYCSGYFLSCNKEVWAKLGGFDLQYSPYDYEDVDISLTALSHGIKLVAMRSKCLKHFQGTTINSINKNRLETTKKNQIKFIEKWIDLIPNIDGVMRYNK